MTQAFDTIIRGALIFDGTGAPPQQTDIGIKDGRIAARGKLPDATGTETIDADGLWLTPGLLDIHTHYDLEVELAPGLPEAVRHGTTTVVVSNCSLGLAFGSLRDKGDDPIVDCFARVENIPKPVLKKVADKVTWDTSDAYLAHLNTLNLGPNIVPMVPYSMLRIAAMGTNASVSRDPSEEELTKMERLLDKCLAEGYAGFSSDALPFHYLANDPNREKRIPSQYGGFEELKRLTNVVRRYGRVWQATPPTESPLKVFKTFLLTSARLYGKALKITAVAALDVRSDRNIIRSAFTLSRILNSKLVGGDFKLQSLAAPFKVWADGPVTPLAEEVPELRQLMMLDLEDDAGRAALYGDPEFEASFKKMWRIGKKGFTIDRLRRILGLEELALRRAIDEMFVDKAPVASWAGECMADIFDRLKRHQAGQKTAKDQDEQAAFEACPPCDDDADFMFHMLKTYDRDLYWWTVSANANDKMLRKLTMSPLFLPGFSDSGAHLTNLAFYDVNLRALKIALEEKGEDGFAYMVKRLTRDPADYFDIAAGSIEVGDQADLTLIDPKALKKHDGVVPLTMIAGRTVWRDGVFGDAFETERCGQVLLADRRTVDDAPQALAAE
ncbi:MAG: N-acyl-D-glutamate deacylase [Pseudomonadota bacterium]